MPNIIETLRDTYATDKAKFLTDAQELFRQFEDGLIVVLPCKVGDTVYVHGLMRTIHPAYVSDVSPNTKKIVFVYKSTQLKDYALFDSFGKTVFLTQAEAEQALKAGEV